MYLSSFTTNHRTENHGLCLEEIGVSQFTGRKFHEIKLDSVYLICIIKLDLLLINIILISPSRLP